MFVSDNEEQDDDNYDEFAVGGVWAEALKGVTGLAGKVVGSGKKGREAKVEQQKNDLKQKELDAEIARTQAKQAAKERSARIIKIVVISILVFLLVGGGIVTWAIFIRKK